MVAWWGNHKITQTLQVCLPYWLLHEPPSAPLFHLLRSVLPSWVVKAPEKSQSSLHSPRDSIQEWGPFSTTTPPGAGAEDQPEFWLHEALNTPARLVHGLPRQLGREEGREWHLCSWPRGRGQARPGTCSACSFPASTQSHSERGFDGQRY